MWGKLMMKGEVVVKSGGGVRWGKVGKGGERWGKV